MTVKTLNIQGTAGEEITLADEVFGIETNKHAVFESIKNERANQRQGTHSTKTRSTVSYAKSKPYRQKGTGRARAGFRGSPLWYHGGVTFGPLPRDYSYRIPRKVKRLAYRSLLSERIRQDLLTIVDDFSPEEGKTKESVAFLGSILSEPSKVLVIYNEEDSKLKRSMRNIPWVTCISCKRLNANDLYYTKHVVLFKSAALELSEYLKG